MLPRDVVRLTADAGDPAFATDHRGAIVAWNPPAEKLFGLAASAALGKCCSDVVNGWDESGSVCSRNCGVRRMIAGRRPVKSYDIEVRTADTRRWCTFSVLALEVAGSAEPYALHLVRDITADKRLEQLLRDCAARSRSPIQGVVLSPRERDVLRRFAAGGTTASIALQLRISQTTVRNHVQHILRKLDAHTRLQAIRRAERTGLI